MLNKAVKHIAKGVCILVDVFGDHFGSFWTIIDHIHYHSIWVPYGPRIDSHQMTQNDLKGPKLITEYITKHANTLLNVFVVCMLSDVFSDQFGSF